jgi:hypothetical protein
MRTVQPPAGSTGSKAVRFSAVGPWRIGNGEKPAGEREPIAMLRVGGGFIVPGPSLKGSDAVQGGAHHAQRRGDAAGIRDRAGGELLDMCGVRVRRGPRRNPGVGRAAGSVIPTRP